MPRKNSPASKVHPGSCARTATRIPVAIILALGGAGRGNRGVGGGGARFLFWRKAACRFLSLIYIFISGQSKKAALKSKRNLHKALTAPLLVT
jgi:hypothetical protein